VKTDHQHVTLIPSNLNAATISPDFIPADGSFHQVTITGGNALGTFAVGAYADDGTRVSNLVQIDIKPFINPTVTFVRIIDNVGGLDPATVPNNFDAPNTNKFAAFLPSQATLQSELDRIFPRQTNIQFTVQDGGQFLYQYDIGGDKKLQFERDNNGKPCYGCSPNSEIAPLKQSFYQTHAQGTPNSFYVFYVDKFSEESIGGFSQPLVPQWPPAVATVWLKSPTPPSNFVSNLTAHELGHVRGRGGSLTVTVNGQEVQVQTAGHPKGKRLLMSETNNVNAFCGISRDDWNIMNFTQGTKIVGADGKAY
jgi:hypothetical protein